MIHVSRTRRSEIVVFGRSQKLLPPIVLGTGAILLNAAEKDDEIEISKIVPSKFGDSDVKLRTSLELAEVIRRVANLGTTYPEVVAILDAANRQKNLPGALVVDAVPESNMDYLQAAILGKDPKAKVDPAVQRAFSGRNPGSGGFSGRVIATWRKRHQPSRTRPRKPQVLPRPPLQRLRTPAALQARDGPGTKHRDGPGNDEILPRPSRPRPMRPRAPRRRMFPRRTTEFNGPAAMIRPRRLPGHACWTGSAAGSTDRLPENPKRGSPENPDCAEHL